MNRILIAILPALIWILTGINPLHAQPNQNAKRKIQAPGQAVDSEKNAILTRQSEDFQSAKSFQEADSIRLLELKNEMLELGIDDHSKKRAITDEQDQIRIKDSLRKILLRLKIDSLRTRIAGFPVVLSRDTLFMVYSKLGSFSPRYRAEVVSERINNLANDYYFNADSLSIVPAELTLDIVYKDKTIISISELDALWMNSTREDLANEHKITIGNAIMKFKIEHSWQMIMEDLLLAALVLAVLIFIIYSVTRLFKWIKSKIEEQKGGKLRGLKIRNYEFLDANRQVTALFSLLNFIKWFIIAVLIYMSLPVLFGIFPWSGGIAGKLVSFFLDPIKNILISIWIYLPNLFTIVVLVIFFRYLLRVLRYFKNEIAKGNLKIPGFYVDWANPTYQIIRILFLAFMLIVIFPYLPGSDSQVFKGVSVFLGVLFTFGSAGALGNVVAGLVLTYMRAYRIGDRVKIGDAIGDVIEKSLLVTKIKTIKNEIVAIPNSTVMSSHTTNFSAEAADRGLILHTSVTIGYDTPWRQIHDLLIKAALATELIDKDPAPFVFQEHLEDFYVSYQINAYTRIANKQHITYSLLHQNIQDVFNEAGVEIMSSHYSNIRDGNKSTVPEEHLPKDYSTPGFNLNLREKESGS